MSNIQVPEAAPDKPYWELTRQIIGAAYEVHSTLGPGFLERVYVSALVKELSESGLRAEREVPVPVIYKGTEIGLYYTDLLVENAVICEVKAIKALAREHEAQLLHYLKATDTKVGLLFDFGAQSAEVSA